MTVRADSTRGGRRAGAKAKRTANAKQQKVAAKPAPRKLSRLGRRQRNEKNARAAAAAAAEAEAQNAGGREPWACWWKQAYQHSIADSKRTELCAPLPPPIHLVDISSVVKNSGRD